VSVLPDSAPSPQIARSGHECAPDPLEICREGLVLARRAGMNWEQAYRPAREAVRACCSLARASAMRLRATSSRMRWL
jgi:hypothetical protein